MRIGRRPEEGDTGSAQRRCSRCRETKPLVEFVRNRSARSGFGAYCKPCHNSVSRRNREKRHGSSRNYLLGHRYGVTPEIVDAFMESQKGRCAVCMRAPARHLDHDHSTGKVRGLLCFSCNGAFGQFEDATSRLVSALSYLSSAQEAATFTARRENEALMLCAVCREWLSPLRFQQEHRRRRGRKPWCSRCGDIAGYAVMGPILGSARRYHLLTKYGIDVHEVEELIRDQRGLCAICLDREPTQVDHDHSTGHVRGILCGGCNAGLGQFREDPEIIRRAIDYLNRHRGDVQEPAAPYILSVA